MNDEFLPKAPHAVSQQSAQDNSASPSVQGKMPARSILTARRTGRTILRSKGDIILALTLAILRDGGDYTEHIPDGFRLSQLNVVFRDRRAFLEVSDEVSTLVAQARAGGGHLVDKEVSIKIGDLTAAIIEAVRFFEALVTQARAMGSGAEGK